MKVQDKSVKRTGNLSGRVINMKFDEKGQAKLAHVLVNLYSDGPSAVIREYAANGRDSHVMAGVDRPIEITLPTPRKPEFIVRDFGTGMSLEDIEEIYSKYGGSTKDQSDDFIGSYGLGCKSALSISPSFTINSNKDGVKTVAVISRESGTLGRIDIIVHTETDEENGVTVNIPVQEKYDDFAAKADNVFLTWAPGTVLVNGQPPAFSMYDKEKFLAVSDVFHVGYDKYQRGTFVNMGGIAYPIDWNQLSTLMDMAFRKSGTKFDDVMDSLVVMTVPIGAVELVPSREAVRWTKVSTGAVVDAMIAGSKALKDSIQQKIEALTDPMGIFEPEIRNLFKSFRHTIKSGGITWNGHDFPLSDISFEDIISKNKGTSLTTYDTGAVFYGRKKHYGSGFSFGFRSDYQYFDDGDSHYIFVDARNSTLTHADVIKHVMNFSDAKNIKSRRIIFNFIRTDIIEKNFWLKTVLEGKRKNIVLIKPEELIDVSKEHQREKARLARLARKDVATVYDVLVPDPKSDDDAYSHKETQAVIPSIEKLLKDNPTYELFVEDKIYNISHNDYRNSQDYFLPDNAVVIMLRGTRTTQAFASRNTDLKFRTDLKVVIGEEVGKRIGGITLEHYFRNSYVDHTSDKLFKLYDLPSGFLRTVIEPLDYTEKRNLMKHSILLHHLKEIRNVEEIKLPLIENVAKAEAIAAEGALFFEGESIWMQEDRSERYIAQMKKYLHGISADVDSIAYS